MHASFNTFPARLQLLLQWRACMACRGVCRDRSLGRAAQVMLGVDRLDMIKGIPQKLLAFEKFLEEHPEWRDKVLLVQIAVPSRTDVPEYQARGGLLLPSCFGGLPRRSPVHGAGAAYYAGYHITGMMMKDSPCLACAPASLCLLLLSV